MEAEVERTLHGIENHRNKDHTEAESDNYHASD